MSRRLALIIGNNDYSNRPLTNCVNDATSLADVLRHVTNCQVELKINLKSEEMYECIRDFTASTKHDDFIIFFFAGHGVQWGDQNFLLPCDNHKIRSGDDMYRYAINAQRTVDGMAKMNPHIVLFLLDCCRSYWIPSKTSDDRGPDQQVGGLKQMKAPRQTLIAFACAAGEVVSDLSSTSSNGLFTKYLIRHLTTPGVHIETILLRVTKDVVAETNDSQRPLRVSNLISEETYLVPKAIEKPSSTSRPKHKSTLSSIDQSINILLIGEKGVGKSTFINAVANYLSFQTVEQAQSNRPVVLKPLSFYMTTNDTYEEKTIQLGAFDPRDQTTTQRCQTYTFDLRQTDGKKLCLIDTPSFEDAQEPDQADSNNIRHILDYVNKLTHLNAVCFLLQPDATRLLTGFQSCFGQLMTRLGRNARDNVIFCFTNALMTFSMPGSTASLLRSMFASLSINDIPFNRENTFFFENESFRYLLAAVNGIQFNKEDKTEYTTSWSESVKESNRLLNYIRRQAVYHIV